MAFNTHVLIELWKAQILKFHHSSIDGHSSPAMILMSLLSFKSLPYTLFGNADLLIRVVTDPESRRTFKQNLLLLTAPMVLAIVIVAGVHCCSLTLGFNYSLSFMGSSALNPSRIPLNCGVAVLSPSESTDTVTVEARDNVSVSCVADVTLELEIMS